MEKLVSIREYARMKGCSETNIRKCIKAGKIHKAIVHVKDKKHPLIDHAVADEEWGKNFNPNYQSNPNLKKQFANEDDDSGDDDDDEVTATQPASEEGGSSTASIKRKHAAIKLQIDFLELKKKQGELVQKDAVYKGLYAAGQEMREHFLSLPDKVIDDIMAAKDRNEAYLILHDGISLVLDNLTDIQKRNFA